MLFRRLTKAGWRTNASLRSDDRVMQYIEREKTIPARRGGFIDRINIFGDSNERLCGRSLLKRFAAGNDRNQHLLLAVANRKITGPKRAMYYIPDHWNKGIMYEAPLAVIRYGFDSMNLYSIGSAYQPGQPGLSPIYWKKAGFYTGRILPGKYFLWRPLPRYRGLFAPEN